MIDENTLDALRAKHGDIHIIDYLDEDIAFRNCPAAEYERWRVDTAGTNDHRRHGAARKLTRAMIVYPDKEGVDALFEKYPAAGDALAAAALKIAGLVEVHVKK